MFHKLLMYRVKFHDEKAALELHEVFFLPF